MNFPFFIKRKASNIKLDDMICFIDYGGRSPNTKYHKVISIIENGELIELEIDNLGSSSKEMYVILLNKNDYVLVKPYLLEYKKYNNYYNGKDYADSDSCVQNNWSTLPKEYILIKDKNYRK